MEKIELINAIYEGIDNDCIDRDIIKAWNGEAIWTITELIKNMIGDVVDYIDIDMDSFDIDGKNNNWHYYTDLVNEWSDSQVDIYNNRLREKAHMFSDYIEDAIQNFWTDIIKDWMIKLLMAWQYEYYNRFSYEVLNTISQILKK